MDDLIDRLRALSRHEHSDYSIGDEAATEIEALRAEVSRQEALKEKHILQSDSWEHRAHSSEAHAKQLTEILKSLLDQLEGVGIYIPGEDSGQWAGTEGLSFMQAETALSKPMVQ